MFKDFITAIRAGLREFSRLRWIRQRRNTINTPF